MRTMRGVSISAKQQYAELTALRKPIFRLDSRLAAVYRECEDAVLHRLDLAMQAFFRRCKRGETPGFPRFKPAARWKQLTFPHGDRALRFVGGRVVVPGAGPVRLRKGRAVPAFGRALIREKAASAVRKVVNVDPRYSSQECSQCGTIAAKSRRRRRFACVAWGFTLHADINAALVIRGRAQLVLTSEPYPAEDAGRRTRCAA
jgi:transposase